MMAGYVNGSGAPREPEDKVTSLDEARRKAALRAKEEKRRARDGRLGAMTSRDWIIGLLFIAMALGMIVHWISPLVGTTGATR